MTSASLDAGSEPVRAASAAIKEANNAPQKRSSYMNTIELLTSSTSAAIVARHDIPPRPERLVELPAAYRNKFMDVVGFNWKAYAAANKTTILLSLFVGILSHVAWDAFTHYDGFFVTLMPVLRSNISIMGKTIPAYLFLQIFSSLAGMWLVYRSIAKMPVSATENFPVKTNIYYWPAFIIVFTIIVISRICIWPEYNSFWGIVMACMGSVIYACFLISFIFKNTQTKKLYA